MELQAKDAPAQSVQNAATSRADDGDVRHDVTYLCRRCGRKLRSAEAKSRGFGYVCYKKQLTETRCKKLFDLPSLQSRKDAL